MYCGRRQGGVRGVVCLATCWLHPQALHGLPPFVDASPGIIKQGCLGLKGLAYYRQGLCDLGGLRKYRQDLCELLETLYSR